MIKLGDTGVSKLCLGDTEIKRAYVGENTILDNESSQSGLPRGYKQVEYIYVNDTKGVKVTPGSIPGIPTSSAGKTSAYGGIYLSDWPIQSLFGYRLEMDVYVPSDATTSGQKGSISRLFGSDYLYSYKNTNSTTTRSNNSCLYVGKSSDKFYVGFYYGTSNTTASTYSNKSSVNEKITIVFDLSKGILQCGTSSASFTAITKAASTADLYPPSLLGTTHHWYGRYTTSGTPAHEYYTGVDVAKNVRLIAMRYYNSDTNELIHNIIPVKNIQSGEAGVYDTVTKSIYYSYAPEYLSAGPAV